MNRIQAHSPEVDMMRSLWLCAILSLATTLVYAAGWLNAIAHTMAPGVLLRRVGGCRGRVHPPSTCDAAEGTAGSPRLHRKANHMNDRTPRKLKFHQAPETRLNRCRPELRQSYLMRQLEHERRGEWEMANRVNLWLTGAFASFEDLISDDVPQIRRHFLRRLCKAGVV